MARLDCGARRRPAALDHPDAARADADDLQAQALLAVLLRRVGRDAEADAVLAALLDGATRSTVGPRPGGSGALDCDAPTLLDVALEYASLGCAGRSAPRPGLRAGRRLEPAAGQVRGPAARAPARRRILGRGR